MDGRGHRRGRRRGAPAGEGRGQHRVCRALRAELRQGAPRRRRVRAAVESRARAGCERWRTARAQARRGHQRRRRDADGDRGSRPYRDLAAQGWRADAGRSMSDVLEFKSSEPLTVGVELELQLVDRRDGDLTRGASDLLALVEKRHPRLDIKLEITESMIEAATGVQRSYSGVLADLRELRDAVCSGAALLNVGVCGGGAHPFQVWTERHIAEGPRMRYISELYGYLAKQFTVFGQHVH